MSDQHTNFKRMMRGYDPAEVDSAIANLRQDVERCQQQQADIAAENEALRKSLEESVAERDHLNAEVSALHATISEAKIEVSEWQKRLAHAERAVAEANAERDRKEIEMVKVAAEAQRESATINTLRDALTRAENELAARRSDEAAVTQSILIARKTADEILAQARAEAAAILDEARAFAEAEESEMRRKIEWVRWDLEQIAQDRHRFVTDFRRMLESHLLALEEAENAPPKQPRPILIDNERAVAELRETPVAEP